MLNLNMRNYFVVVVDLRGKVLIMIEGFYNVRWVVVCNGFLFVFLLVFCLFVEWVFLVC